MTRRERRAERQRRLVTKSEARWAARVARLDYRVTENGALKPPTKGRTWHQGNRGNGHRPPPGRGWDRSGPAYVVALDGIEFAQPVLHHRWRRFTTDRA